MSDLNLLTTFDTFDYTLITEDDKSKVGGSKKVLMKGLLQKADTLNQNGRIYPANVLEREVRNYQKFILENRALGELDHPDCVPTGSEIFTSEGWKKIEDIRVDEVVATLNIETNNIEYQKILKKIDQPYVGKMYRFKNSKSFDMTLTPNHRMLAWDRNKKPYFVTAEGAASLWNSADSFLSHSGLRRAGDWIGEEPEVIEIANKLVDSRLWAAFLGIYLAEGHSSGVKVKERQKVHDVVITQNEGETCDAIRKLLKSLPWEFVDKTCEGKPRHDFCIKDEALHSHLIHLGDSHEKHVPKYVKTWGTSLLSVLLEWMLAGDGRHRYGYKKECIVPEYCTTSTKLANDVCDIMLKLGHGATIHTYQPDDRQAPDYSETGRMILSENSEPMNIVYQHSSAGMSLDHRFMQVEAVDYDGHVHCVSVPNQTWLMKQNGKTCWTGNSSVVNLKNVSHIVREAYMENGNVIGTVEILNTPSGQILQSLVESKVKLGISSRGVGSTQKQGEYYVVQDDFQLICWDYVSEPSTPGAFMIPEGKKISSGDVARLLNKSDKIDRILNDILQCKK